MGTLPARPCAVCQRGFTPRRRGTLYCSERCKTYWKWRKPAYKARHSERLNRRRATDPRFREKEREAQRKRDRMPERRVDRTLPRHHTCDRCGADFIGKRQRQYCDKCLAPKPKTEPTSCLLRWAACEWCGQKFVKHGPRRYCSEMCMRARPSQTEIRYLECQRCGRGCFRPARYKSTCCSPACNKALKGRQRKNHKRAGGEQFPDREIFERDGWVCHLCGKPVPDRKYEARDDDPTLDHLTPVSKGGLHVRENVKLAHNRCNWERADADLAA